MTEFSVFKTMTLIYVANTVVFLSFLLFIVLWIWELNLLSSLSLQMCFCVWKRRWKNDHVLRCMDGFEILYHYVF